MQQPLVPKGSMEKVQRRNDAQVTAVFKRPRRLLARDAQLAYQHARAADGIAREEQIRTDCRNLLEQPEEIARHGNLIDRAALFSAFDDKPAAQERKIAGYGVCARMQA